MQALFTPHLGLMFWTIVTFLLLVFILGKYGWKPLVDGIESRERFLREQKRLAEEARMIAEESRVRYERQLLESQKTIQEMIATARADAERARGEMIASAKTEADRFIEKGRRDLAGETDKLRAALQAEVANLSLTVAEKILNRAIDKKVADEVMNEAVKSVSEAKR